jgi:hypothetical protein
MKTKFEVLDISMDDLHEFLKDADYRGYSKARTWAYAKLQENDCNMSKEYFAVFWNRLMAKVVKKYGYKIPKSVEVRAEYQRAYRQKMREKDALRMRKIRANEAYKAKLASIRIENAHLQKENLEALEEIGDRLAYLALDEDLKT